MKKLISLVLVMVTLVSVVGCSDDSLKVFLPGNYISDDVVKAFEEETGIKVKLDTFESNEEMLIKLEGSNSVYDVIIPSDYMIEKLKEEKLLQKLNKELIPNISLLYDGVKNASYDPNNDYTVPYFWGNVGICYDTRKILADDVLKQGWDIFHDTKYSGLMYLYDSERDEYMIGLKAQGYSMNTQDETELDKASAWLKQIVDTMDPQTVTDEAIDGLAYPEDTDEKYFGMMYNGDAAYILSVNENARFYAPETGTNYFIDAMCVHSKSSRLDDACKFINYMISYEAQLANSTEIGYSSVNGKALQELAETEFKGNEAYLPRTRTELDEDFHSNEFTRNYLATHWVDIINK